MASARLSQQQTFLWIFLRKNRGTHRRTIVQSLHSEAVVHLIRCMHMWTRFETEVGRIFWRNTKALNFARKRPQHDYSHDLSLNSPPSTNCLL